MNEVLARRTSAARFRAKGRLHHAHDRDGARLRERASHLELLWPSGLAHCDGKTPPGAIPAGFREHSGRYFVNIPWLVEVAGIEPASVGFLVGLLRAQPSGDCRERRCCRHRRRPVSDLVVPSSSPAQVLGKPYFMMPIYWSVGLGPGGHRCPRQRARAEARRLFLVPALLRGSGDHGSLLPPRRPTSRPFTPVSRGSSPRLHCTKAKGGTVRGVSRVARRRAGHAPCRAPRRAWRAPGGGRRASCPWRRRARP